MSSIGYFISAQSVDISQIFRKTTLGSQSFADANAALSKTQRNALIMVDGKRSVDAISRITAAMGGTVGVFDELLALGMIEANAEPAIAASTMSGYVEQARGVDARAQLTPAQRVDALEASRRYASKYVSDTLGVHGDKMSLLLERSKSEGEFLNHIESAQSILKSYKGTKAAADLRLYVDMMLPVQR
jgi:hypothetical protein